MQPHFNLFDFLAFQVLHQQQQQSVAVHIVHNQCKHQVFVHPDQLSVDFLRARHALRKTDQVVKSFVVMIAVLIVHVSQSRPFKLFQSSQVHVVGCYLAQLIWLED